MGSASECMLSIVVCLYVRCADVFLCVHLRVGMYYCDCVRLFLRQVGSWAALLDQFRSPIKCVAYFISSCSLSVAGVSACRCVGGSWCQGLGAQACDSSLPGAAW
ncbi:hypothetical protein CHARACLAT_024735 [Characodon lateralis]|uniref:Secreted protein n=1 Tax=Characodon lateralis TaxID=208331 RepID=A0ABU7EFI9_9TELE|nr:hypothetical protein [Characodon lateralis]